MKTLPYQEHRMVSVLMYAKPFTELSGWSRASWIILQYFWTIAKNFHIPRRQNEKNIFVLQFWFLFFQIVHAQSVSERRHSGNVRIGVHFRNNISYSCATLKELSGVPNFNDICKTVRVAVGPSASAFVATET